MSGERAVAPRPRSWRAAVGVAVAVLGIAAGGCDGNESSRSGQAADRHDVSEAVGAVQRAFRAGDRHALCARMDATARRQAGSVAHGSQDECPEDLGEAFDVIDAGGGIRARRHAQPVAATVMGDEGTATVAVEGHGSVDVPLTRGGSGWRLASFFGTPPREAEAAMARDRPAPFPPARGAVTVTERGGPCLPLFAEGYPQIAGGCELHASTRRLRLTIGTVFGSFRFGHCELGYRVLVDRKGRAWTDSVELRGPKGVNNGCSDVRGCENSASEPLPWEGRISMTGDGDVVHRMNVCLDTCIGFYLGPLTVEMSRRPGRGWRADATRAAVGATGLRFDGAIEVGTAGGLRIGAAG